jgi:hypothetical protein
MHVEGNGNSKRRAERDERTCSYNLMGVLLLARVGEARGSRCSTPGAG